MIPLENLVSASLESAGIVSTPTTPIITAAIAMGIKTWALDATRYKEKVLVKNQWGYRQKKFCGPYYNPYESNHQFLRIFLVDFNGTFRKISRVKCRGIKSLCFIRSNVMNSCRTSRYYSTGIVQHSKCKKDLTITSRAICKLACHVHYVARKLIFVT